MPVVLFEKIDQSRAALAFDLCWRGEGRCDVVQSRHRVRATVSMNRDLDRNRAGWLPKTMTRVVADPCCNAAQ